MSNEADNKHLKVVYHLRDKLATLTKTHKLMVHKLREKLETAELRNKQLQRELEFAQSQARSQNQGLAQTASPMSQEFDINNMQKGSLSDTQLSALRKHFEKELSKQINAVHERDEKINLLETTLNQEETESLRLKTIVEDLNEKNKSNRKKVKVLSEQNEKLRLDLDEAKHKVKNHNIIVKEEVERREEMINKLEIEITELTQKIKIIKERNHHFDILKMKEVMTTIRKESQGIIHRGNQDELNHFLVRISEIHKWISSSRIQTKEELENLFIRITDLENEVRNRLYKPVSMAI